MVVGSNIHYQYAQDRLC